MSSSKRSKSHTDSYCMQVLNVRMFIFERKFYFFHFFLFIRSSIFFHQTSVLLVCLCPTNIFSLPQNSLFFLCLTMLSFPLYAVLPLLGSKHQITVRNLMILFTGLLFMLNFNTIKSVELIFCSILFQRQRSFDSGV